MNNRTSMERYAIGRELKFRNATVAVENGESSYYTAVDFDTAVREALFLYAPRWDFEIR